jgi:hypothetical protein
MNATRHGGCTRLITEDELQAFREFTEPLIAGLKTANENEYQLALSYATLQWRINRIAAVEDTIFTTGEICEIAENFNIDHAQAHTAASNAKMYLQDPAVFDRLSIYTQRLINSSAKVLKQLQQMQAERKKEETADMREAKTIYKAHQEAGGIFEPEKVGFVLPVSAIEAEIRRDGLRFAAFVAEEVKKGTVKAA